MDQPDVLQARILAIRRVVREFTAANHRTPTVDEVASELHMLGGEVIVVLATLGQERATDHQRRHHSRARTG